MLSCFKDLSLSFGFVWKESLWEDFWTLWGWVCLSCLVGPGLVARNQLWSLVSGN